MIDATKSGLAGALILYGEAGMGKTELIDYAVSSAADLRLLRMAGVEAESQFGFAALHRLLAPLMGDLEYLPAPQREALSSAVGLVSQAPADLFLVGLATLTLLASSASSQGLMCIVDDAQWIDQESLSALAFVGRRLSADRIALIFGYRTSDTASPILSGIPDLPVTGLPEHAAIELLSSAVQGQLDDRTARRIVTETSGCPLALTELAGDLTAGQLAGADPISEPIPISRQLEEHFHRRIEVLPRTTQTFLLIAAAETSGETAVVRRVARELGCERDEEEAAVRMRLLAAIEPRIEFRHPLIRSAVYAGASASERRSVHKALANSIDRSTEPDRWARHAAAAASGPDDGLAADLEAAAHRARDRGGYTAESSLLAQAAELTEGLAERSARLLDASAAALNAGSARRADNLLIEARRGLSDPLLLAEAQQLDGRLRVPLVQNPDAPAFLLEAARQFRPLDVDRARESMLEAFDAFLTCQHFSKGVTSADIANVALDARHASPRSQLTDLVLDGISLLVGVGYREAVEVLRRAGRQIRDGPNSMDDLARWFKFGMIVSNELMDDRAYIAWTERAENVARQRGALIALQTSLVGLAEHHIRAGEFSAAEADFAEVLEITAAIGGLIEVFRPLNTMLLAWRSDDLGTRAGTKAMVEVGSIIGSAVLVFLGYRALAILELGVGNYSAALHAAEKITDEEAIGWRFQTLPIVVEAGVRSGNRIAADRALAELHLRATATGTPWALGLLARSQALLADDAEAESLFAESISQLEQTLVATDLALAHLSYGEWLRRQHRRVDARTHLRTAHDMLASMGAAGFAERARTELLATGERVSRRTVENQTDLTAQELQIAQLASRGATNPEIATKLFLSASTVDYHLRKVFRKLGITSRRQLEGSLPS